jgi:hypothetical protein
MSEESGVWQCRERNILNDRKSNMERGLWVKWAKDTTFSAISLFLYLDERSR